MIAGYKESMKKISGKPAFRGKNEDDEGEGGAASTPAPKKKNK